MADQPRFDRGAILRASAIIIGGAAVFGLAVPIIGALAVSSWDTLKVSGNEIYRWAYWAIAWALTVWQGSWMLRKVHDRIIDDMIVTAALSAILLLVVKFIVWIAYEPISSDGVYLFAITPIDVGGALMLVVVALIGARANRY